MCSSIQGDVAAALDGEAVCILAYGASGSGKTFAIDRLADRVASDLETQAAELQDSLSSVKVFVQMFELSGDQPWDLLADDGVPPQPEALVRASRSHLSLRGGAAAAAAASVAAWRECGHQEGRGLAKGVQHWLRAGRSRQEQLWKSSPGSRLLMRSHVAITFQLVTTSSQTGESRLVGRLSLIDLAASDQPPLALSHSAPRAGEEAFSSHGGQLKEVQSALRSLSVLADVIQARESGCSYVPYRSSKLTHLLQESLGGCQDRCRTVILLTLDPSAEVQTETLRTLQFGSRLCSFSTAHARGSGPRRSSVTSAMMQVDSTAELGDMDDDDLRAELERLRQNTAEAKANFVDYESRLKEKLRSSSSRMQSIRELVDGCKSFHQQLTAVTRSVSAAPEVGRIRGNESWADLPQPVSSCPGRRAAMRSPVLTSSSSCESGFKAQTVRPVLGTAGSQGKFSRPGSPPVKKTSDIRPLSPAGRHPVTGKCLRSSPQRSPLSVRGGRVASPMVGPSVPGGPAARWRGASPKAKAKAAAKAVATPVSSQARSAAKAAYSAGPSTQDLSSPPPQTRQRPIPRWRQDVGGRSPQACSPVRQPQNRKPLQGEALATAARAKNRLPQLLPPSAEQVGTSAAQAKATKAVEAKQRVQRPKQPPLQQNQLRSGATTPLAAQHTARAAAAIARYGGGTPGGTPGNRPLGRRLGPRDLSPGAWRGAVRPAMRGAAELNKLASSGLKENERSSANVLKHNQFPCELSKGGLGGPGSPSSDSDFSSSCSSSPGSSSSGSRESRACYNRQWNRGQPQDHLRLKLDLTNVFRDAAEAKAAEGRASVTARPASWGGQYSVPNTPRGRPPVVWWNASDLQTAEAAVAPASARGHAPKSGAGTCGSRRRQTSREYVVEVVSPRTAWSLAADAPSELEMARQREVVAADGTADEEKQEVQSPMLLLRPPPSELDGQSPQSDGSSTGVGPGGSGDSPGGVSVSSDEGAIRLRLQQELCSRVARAASAAMEAGPAAEDDDDVETGQKGEATEKAVDISPSVPSKLTGSGVPLLHASLPTPSRSPRPSFAPEPV
eukprot:TRINITY_DN31229_c0_g1_i1.p1 TRINITY_DN31229_c0_g1~~TRINITY_DN31229_c0_g1_i1.p1  ORF type:complete len:1248 (+),score=235.38 TRINITY_DN31229_c0_g1_i1:541-3744(+)